jgi:hypothetical protein
MYQRINPTQLQSLYEQFRPRGFEILASALHQHAEHTGILLLCRRVSSPTTLAGAKRCIIGPARDFAVG